MPIDEIECQSLISLKHVLNYIKKQEKYSLIGHFDDVNLAATSLVRCVDDPFSIGAK